MILHHMSKLGSSEARRPPRRTPRRSEIYIASLLIIACTSALFSLLSCTPVFSERTDAVYLERSAPANVVCQASGGGLGLFRRNYGLLPASCTDTVCRRTRTRTRTTAKWVTKTAYYVKAITSRKTRVITKTEHRAVGGPKIGARPAPLEAGLSGTGSFAHFSFPYPSSDTSKQRIYNLRDCQSQHSASDSIFRAKNHKNNIHTQLCDRFNHRPCKHPTARYHRHHNLDAFFHVAGYKECGAAMWAV